MWESKLFSSCPVHMWLKPTVCSALWWHLQRYCYPRDANNAVEWISYPESSISNSAVFKRLRMMWVSLWLDPWTIPLSSFPQRPLVCSTFYTTETLKTINQKKKRGKGLSQLITSGSLAFGHLSVFWILSYSKGEYDVREWVWEGSKATHLMMTVGRDRVELRF